LISEGLVPYFSAVILGLVEGLTEFLPISSTGHLILVERFACMSDDPASPFPFAFTVIIQLPAILAVVLYFWSTLWPFRSDRAHRDATVLLWTKIVIAVLPAVVLGLLLDKFIEAHLTHAVPVAIALVVGGIVLIFLERRRASPLFERVGDIGIGTGVCIGFFQCLAMWPGVSRSAATIIGAMALGASRCAAAEFSFFLAVPTMLGATSLKLVKGGFGFTTHEWVLLGIGCAVSFATAYAVIAFLMNYVRRHDFIPFGYYRIALGLVVLAAYALSG
jgi:undecaprenyl-diphosphatase